MNHWTSYFDKVFLINLPERKDRLIASMEELKRYNIPFERWEAIKSDNGLIGLSLTMMELFKESIKRKYKRILVFEDDVKFLIDPTEVMTEVMEQLPVLWHLLYLGCNPTIPFKEFFSENLLCNERSFSSHAVGYHKFAIEAIYKSGATFMPYDSLLAEGVQKAKNSYCVYPMLATQRESYSDIEKRYVTNYADYLENRFAEQTKHLL